MTVRFIPVYTGNIWTLDDVLYAPPVYPCVYREHRRQFQLVLMFHGLSLCIQGTFSWDTSHWCSIRFIPVYTGNMYFRRGRAIAGAVYPCVYREHKGQSKKLYKHRGLSLCIQGTFYYWFDVHNHFRFIPVYTGNIICKVPFLKKGAVYPCVYREHTTVMSKQHFKTGLSLCIQGTSRTGNLVYQKIRFIPVYTGNMQRQQLILITQNGLSLCIQGTCVHIILLPLKWRFIPVYTGNMDQHQLDIHLYSVYPCVYREHKPPLFLANIHPGLSLCIQGTSITFTHAMNSRRFIPVYTGNILTPADVWRLKPVYPCVYREHNKLSTLT